jgi:hypothetical protein
MTLKKFMAMSLMDTQNHDEKWVIKNTKGGKIYLHGFEFQPLKKYGLFKTFYCWMHVVTKRSQQSHKVHSRLNIKKYIMIMKYK